MSEDNFEYIDKLLFEDIEERNLKLIRTNNFFREAYNSTPTK